MADRLSARDIMETLIAFPTVSHDSNLPLVDWVEAYLADHDIVAHRYYNDDGTKAALFAHVGPWQEGAVILSGHTDVVPVDGQDWSTDPFTVVERDGKYFGRGTCDMKGFDAMAIWALVEAQHRGVKTPLQLALSFDEEIGCTGAPPMIEAMQPILPKGAAVIVGEPSMMKAVTGHKGGTGYHVYMRGHEVHSSLLHTGVSAIMSGAKLIEWVNQQNAANQARAPGELAAVFDPPWTTQHVGMISGGTAHNITARDCQFAVECRCVPGETLADWDTKFLARVTELQEEMQSVHPDAGIDLERFFGVPGLVPETDGAAEALVRALTGDNGTHVVSYGTEAGQFQEAGYSAVICGPGDIEQAHKQDEFITIKQFEAGVDFMDRLITRLQGE